MDRIAFDTLFDAIDAIKDKGIEKQFYFYPPNDPHASDEKSLMIILV